MLFKFRLIIKSLSQNNHISGGTIASCIESITIKVKNDNRNAIIVLKHHFEVEVNGQKVESFPLNVLGDYVCITFPSWNKVSVTFKDGFRIFYDGGHNVEIDAISLYNGKMVGLCEKSASHKKSKRSTEENDMKSWIAQHVRESCIGESCNTIDEALNIPHPCESSLAVRKRAEEACARLKSDIFSICHPHIDPKTYYDNCLYDVCAFDDETSMCMNYAAYANECSRSGKVIKHWRQSVQECGGCYFSRNQAKMIQFLINIKKTFLFLPIAIKCPDGQIYEECSNYCYRSCGDLQLFAENCTRDCIDGCRCPEGKALDENNVCIPIDMCPRDRKIRSFDCDPRDDRIEINQEWYVRYI